jgi:hypothetical protein
LLAGFPRYNQNVLIPRTHSRFLSVSILAASACWAASCGAPLGPGYTIERQQVSVQFEPAPAPRIRIEADYQLKNTGNQPLKEIEVRLPGRRRFHFENPRASWDSTTLAIEVGSESPRNAVFTFPKPWSKSARHTLHLSVEYLPAQAGETTLSFSEDAFFLPAQGWSPELLPTGGLFGSGGVPPKKWELSVRVPEGFLIHTSGEKARTSSSHGELTVRAVQQAKDRYPFVVAGRYSSAQMGSGKEKIYLWTRKAQEAVGLGQAGDALVRTMEAYDSFFGAQAKESSATWIVECPVVAGCFTNFNPTTAKLLGEDEKEPTTAEMVSQDTIVVDMSGGTAALAVSAAPSLASSWLGYAQNPGFYEQDPPLSVFPAFAASVGREAAEGADSRAEAIRRVLRLIPAKMEPHAEESPAVVRAKSLLFFYALQDKYGREVFRTAIQHMLYARRGRGFELSDLIAAFEQETHQNVAEFVRLWMKQPGIPDDFRTKYEPSAAADNSKETTP